MKKSSRFISIVLPLTNTHLILFITAYSISIYYHDVAVIGDSFVDLKMIVPQIETWIYHTRLMSAGTHLVDWLFPEWTPY